LHQTAKVGEIGDRQCWHTQRRRLFYQRRGFGQAIDHRVVAVHPQVYETWFRHLQIPVYLISTQESGRKSQCAFDRPKAAPMVFGRAVFSQFFQMKSGWVPFVLAKPYCGKTISSAAISASRVTFARIDAALISGTRLSPFTTAIAGIGNFGQRLPSINTYSGAICSPATARCIASMVA